MISRIIRYKMEDLFCLKHISLGRNGFMYLSNYLCSLTNQWKTENTPLALCHKIQWKFTSAIDVIFFQSLKNKVFVNWKCFGLRGYFRPMACSCQDHMTELPFLFLLQRHLSFYCNSWWMCHPPLLLNLLFFKGSKRGSKRDIQITSIAAQKSWHWCKDSLTGHGQYREWYKNAFGALFKLHKLVAKGPLLWQCVGETFCLDKRQATRNDFRWLFIVKTFCTTCRKIVIQLL